MLTNQDAINVIKSTPITILEFLAVTSITKYMKKPCKETADEVTMNVGVFLAKVSIDSNARRSREIIQNKSTVKLCPRG